MRYPYAFVVVFFLQIHFIQLLQARRTQRVQNIHMKSSVIG